MGKKGFTLIELVIVIVILGILAAIALPKFVDLTTSAKVSATKAGLGAIRAAIALKYSQNLATNTTIAPSAAYPTTLAATDFFDGKMPLNQLNGETGITILAAAPNGTDNGGANGWWMINPTVTASAGQAGAYSDGTQNTSTW